MHFPFNQPNGQCNRPIFNYNQVENVNLYATKYEEEFQPHLPTFATAVWELLKASGVCVCVYN